MPCIWGTKASIRERLRRPSFLPRRNITILNWSKRLYDCEGGMHYRSHRQGESLPQDCINLLANPLEHNSSCKTLLLRNHGNHTNTRYSELYDIMWVFFKVVLFQKRSLFLFLPLFEEKEKSSFSSLESAVLPLAEDHFALALLISVLWHVVLAIGQAWRIRMGAFRLLTGLRRLWRLRARGILIFVLCPWTLL